MTLPLRPFTTLPLRHTENKKGDRFITYRPCQAPQVGLEPTTLRLTAACSAIELLRNSKGHYTKKGMGVKWIKLGEFEAKEKEEINPN